MDKAATLRKLKDDPCYESAEDYGEDKCYDPGCNGIALGVLYYWCGDSRCCSSPVAFYCEDHLIEKFGDKLAGGLT